MATPTADVFEFCSLLSKSKLLPAEEVEAVYRRWKEEKQPEEERVEAFAKFLVSKRILTPWQSALVQRGRADGFFLERYKILDQIGKGQMGGVYKAVHSLGQLVALKILPASRAKDPRVLGRFQREARLLTHLDHPNVVRAFQVGESGGRHFIVMEFLEGETLDEVLTRRKKLPPGEAVRLIRQALDGLQHLHDKRMVHRDLKPSNLMIIPAGGKGSADSTWEATVKIVDIGLGRELFDESAPEGAIDTQLTVEGAVVGTPDYMAPEQAKDARSADIRADIYSLGCVLYHALTGRTPFLDANIMTQMLKHATEMPPPLASVVEGIPAGLQGVLNRLIAKSPDDRFPTPAEGSKALEPFQTPGTGTSAAREDVSPAFKQWLETETQMVMPPPAPPAPSSTAHKPLENKHSGAAPLPSHSHAKPKPGTAPAPALPARPSGNYPYAAPAPAPAPAWQSRTQPIPDDDGINVELVTLPPAMPMPLMPMPAPQAMPDGDRPLTDLTRRDLYLLSLGGLGVFLAVGAGYALTSLLKGSSAPAPTAEDEKKE
ncbi:MAG TPA: serine/threonine-protein kinase [Urbifossiella sp.]|nr:serine/threonine-protein kinase [Urbifossiella sp.]